MTFKRNTNSSYIWMDGWMDGRLVGWMAHCLFLSPSPSWHLSPVHSPLRQSVDHAEQQPVLSVVAFWDWPSWLGSSICQILLCPNSRRLFSRLQLQLSTLSNLLLLSLRLFGLVAVILQLVRLPLPPLSSGRGAELPLFLFICLFVC